MSSAGYTVASKVADVELGPMGSKGPQVSKFMKSREPKVSLTIETKTNMNNV